MVLGHAGPSTRLIKNEQLALVLCCLMSEGLQRSALVVARQARLNASVADVTAWLSAATAGQATASMHDADVAGPGMTLTSTGSFEVRISHS